MRRQFSPGDWVRLERDVRWVDYPILWRLVSRIKRECPLVVQESIYDEKLETEFIRVRWPNGKMSGAMYADIFVKVYE